MPETSEIREEFRSIAALDDNGFQGSMDWGDGAAVEEARLEIFQLQQFYGGTGMAMYPFNYESLRAMSGLAELDAGIGRVSPAIRHDAVIRMLRDTELMLEEAHEAVEERKHKAALRHEEEMEREYWEQEEDGLLRPKREKPKLIEFFNVPAAGHSLLFAAVLVPMAGEVIRLSRAFGARLSDDDTQRDQARVLKPPVLH